MPVAPRKSPKPTKPHAPAPSLSISVDDKPRYTYTFKKVAEPDSAAAMNEILEFIGAEPLPPYRLAHVQYPDVHILPGSEPQHPLSRACPCQPTIIHCDVADIVVHNYAEEPEQPTEPLHRDLHGASRSRRTKNRRNR